MELEGPLLPVFEALEISALQWVVGRTGHWRRCIAEDVFT